MIERSTRIISGAVILMFFTICIIAGCISQQTSGSKIPTLIPNASQPVNTATFPTPDRVTTVPTLSGSNDVKIRGNDFEPGMLVIMNGTTVTWTNEDDQNNEYSVISDNGTPTSFQSGIISKGGIFKFRFKQPGTYPYHSTITSEITGEIVVL